LDQCLDSLRAQTFAELEVVAIDDGSTDASPSILSRHAAQDGRIRVIAKRNTGYGDSMNRGIEAARGQWVGICEPDDFVDANAFATYLAASRLSDDVDIVKANHYEFSGGMQGEGGECAFEGGSSVVVHNYDAFPSSVPFPAESRPDIVRTIPAIWAGIYRKSMLDAHSVRFSPTPGDSFQDTAFLLQAWMSARSVVLLHDAFARYRTDNDSSSSVSGDKVFAVCDEFEKSFEALRSYGSAKQLLFEPQLHAQRMEAYYWNYNRIDPAQHLAFTRRWADELAQAQDRGMLHRDLFSHESWEHVQELLADPEAFCAKHPHHV
ncbi:MAG: glycosyltransferase family 2 protein, partial [Eggerthellaceae bacterium]|nr:glycosyltransferase family 2 protein [Eggerthellaceae bacterium]